MWWSHSRNKEALLLTRFSRLFYRSFSHWPVCENESSDRVIIIRVNWGRWAQSWHPKYYAACHLVNISWPDLNLSRFFPSSNPTFCLPVCIRRLLRSQLRPVFCPHDPLLIRVGWKINSLCPDYYGWRMMVWQRSAPWTHHIISRVTLELSCWSNWNQKMKWAMALASKMSSWIRTLF